MSRVCLAKFIMAHSRSGGHCENCICRDIASLAETALNFLEMAQLDYANQENNEDDDLPILYKVLLFFSKGLVVGEFYLSMLNLKGKY